MRRIALAAILILSGCAAPRPAGPAAPPPAVATPQPQTQERSAVVGMTASELVAHFGNPALQIREGNSVKLQFRSSACVLDAYLYPPAAGGTARVTHIDARLPSGVDTDAQGCATQLNRGS